MRKFYFRSQLFFGVITNASLVSPNDNSLAQAEWAIPRLSKIDTAKYLNIPGSYEANTRHATRLGDWKKAYRSCVDWAWDEPYSSSPCAAGSYLASTVLDDHELSLQFCEQGLRANPEDNDLINNKTVNLASLGRIDEAEEAFLHLHDIDEKETLSISTVATAGLLKYRQGFTEIGRTLYEGAVDKAISMHRRDYAALAAIYQAKEEKRIESDKSDMYFNKAVELARKTDDKVVQEIKNI